MLSSSPSQSSSLPRQQYGSSAATAPTPTNRTSDLPSSSGCVSQQQQQYNNLNPTTSAFANGDGRQGNVNNHHLRHQQQPQQQAEEHQHGHPLLHAHSNYHQSNGVPPSLPSSPSPSCPSQRSSHAAVVDFGAFMSQVTPEEEKRIQFERTQEERRNAKHLRSQQHQQQHQYNELTQQHQQRTVQPSGGVVINNTHLPPMRAAVAANNASGSSMNSINTVALQQQQQQQQLSRGNHHGNGANNTSPSRPHAHSANVTPQHTNSHHHPLHHHHQHSNSISGGGGMGGGGGASTSMVATTPTAATTATRTATNQLVGGGNGTFNNTINIHNTINTTAGSNSNHNNDVNTTPLASFGANAPNSVPNSGQQQLQQQSIIGFVPFPITSASSPPFVAAAAPNSGSNHHHRRENTSSSSSSIPSSIIVTNGSYQQQPSNANNNISSSSSAPSLSDPRVPGGGDAAAINTNSANRCDLSLMITNGSINGGGGNSSLISVPTFTTSGGNQGNIVPEGYVDIHGQLVCKDALAKQQGIKANQSPFKTAEYHPMIGPAHPSRAKRILLCIDIDETLLHSTLVPSNQAVPMALLGFDALLPIEPHGRDVKFTDHPIHNRTIMRVNPDSRANSKTPIVCVDPSYDRVCVHIRPFAREFLELVDQLFEVVIFTASMEPYANLVMEALDPNGRLTNVRLYRQHCADKGGNRVKDLTLLGRSLDRICIIDNSPKAYQFQPRNAVPIESFFQNPRDLELRKLFPLFERLAVCESVYDVLDPFNAFLVSPEPEEVLTMASPVSRMSPSGAMFISRTPSVHSPVASHHLPHNVSVGGGLDSGLSPNNNGRGSQPASPTYSRTASPLSVARHHSRSGVIRRTLTAVNASSSNNGADGGLLQQPQRQVSLLLGSTAPLPQHPSKGGMICSNIHGASSGVGGNGSRIVALGPAIDTTHFVAPVLLGGSLREDRHQNDNDNNNTTTNNTTPATTTEGSVLTVSTTSATTPRIEAKMAISVNSIVNNTCPEGDQYDGEAGVSTRRGGNAFINSLVGRPAEAAGGDDANADDGAPFQFKAVSSTVSSRQGISSHANTVTDSALTESTTPTTTTATTTLLTPAATHASSCNLMAKSTASTAVSSSPLLLARGGCGGEAFGTPSQSVSTSLLESPPRTLNAAGSTHTTTRVMAPVVSPVNGVLPLLSHTTAETGASCSSSPTHAHHAALSPRRQRSTSSNTAHHSPIVNASSTASPLLQRTESILGGAACPAGSSSKYGRRLGAAVSYSQSNSPCVGGADDDESGFQKALGRVSSLVGVDEEGGGMPIGADEERGSPTTTKNVVRAFAGRGSIVGLGRTTPDNDENDDTDGSSINSPTQPAIGHLAGGSKEAGGSRREMLSLGPLSVPTLTTFAQPPSHQSATSVSPMAHGGSASPPTECGAQQRTCALQQPPSSSFGTASGGGAAGCSSANNRSTTAVFGALL